MSDRNAARAAGRLMFAGDHSGVSVGPHPFIRMGWRFWLCRHCYAPRSLHPRTIWVKARPLRHHMYLSSDAPHFKEGW